MHPLGESPYEVVFVGVVRHYRDRHQVENGRRDIRECPRCRWVNIFRPLAEERVDSQKRPA